MDHTEDRFALSQIQFASQKSPQGKFTRLGERCTCIKKFSLDHLQKDRSPEAVDLDGRLTGVAFGIGPHKESDIDFPEAVESDGASNASRVFRGVKVSKNTFGDRDGIRPCNTDRATGGSDWSRCDRTDGCFSVELQHCLQHGLPRRKVGLHWAFSVP
ncbi:MAG: hypothetical protein MUC43_19325, partial [Pirellula sp.]|nr:hypothetical protein [Pirellula sp.]